MNLTIDKAPESEYKLFPVAEELIPKGIKTITYKEQLFEIVDYYTFHKKEFFPTGFMKFVFGQEIEPRKIWERYKKSEKLLVFICKPIKSEKKDSKKIADFKPETAVPTLFPK